MAVVRSYIAAHWFTPDVGIPVADTVTDEPVAEVCSAGIDCGGAR